MDAEKPTTNNNSNDAAAAPAKKIYKGWDERYSELSQYKAKYGTFDGLIKIDRSLYWWANKQRHHETLSSEKRNKLEAIGFSLKPPKRAARTTKSWDERYSDLSQHKEKYGTLDGLSQIDPSLYCWANNQRSRNLSSEERNKLEAIGFILETSQQDLHNDATAREQHRRWDEQYAELSQYKTKHGTFEGLSTENRSLYLWAYKQRQDATLLLSSEQQNKLEALGLKFDRAKHNEKWKANYDRLVAFQTVHGHCNVPKTADKSLASWVRNQRMRKIGMQKARQTLLNRIGFVWGKKKDWKARYDQLAAFQKANGHCSLKAQDDSKLTAWTHSQRSAMRNGSLTKERELLLNQIGFIWAKSASSKQPDSSVTMDDDVPIAGLAGISEDHEEVDEEDDQFADADDDEESQTDGEACDSDASNSLPNNDHIITETWNNIIALTGREALLSAQAKEDKRGCMLDAGTGEAVTGVERRMPLKRSFPVPEAQTILASEEVEQGDCKSDSGSCNTFFGVEQQQPNWMKRSLPHTPLSEEAFEWNQSDATDEYPTPKRPKHDDYDEFESSKSYFARKTSPYDTFSI